MTTTYYSEGLRRRTVVSAGLSLLTTVIVGSVGVRYAFAEDAGVFAGPPQDGGVGPDGNPEGSTTPNGWPVLTAGGTVGVEVARRSLQLAPGPAQVVLSEFVRRFDRRVERIGEGTLDDWSYARRAVRGVRTVWSEHAAGTAVDLNATRHPQGVRRTFPGTKEKSLRRLLDDFDGVVGWGGDFDVPDEMHFEIAVGPDAERLRRLAARLS